MDLLKSLPAGWLINMMEGTTKNKTTRNDNDVKFNNNVLDLWDRGKPQHALNFFIWSFLHGMASDKNRNWVVLHYSLEVDHIIDIVSTIISATKNNIIKSYESDVCFILGFPSGCCYVKALTSTYYVTVFLFQAEGCRFWKMYSFFSPFHLQMEWSSPVQFQLRRLNTFHYKYSTIFRINSK